MGYQNFARKLESSNGLLAAHRWKLLQELVQRLSHFDIVEKGFHRHPGTDEHRSPPKDVGIYMDDLSSCCHSSISLFPVNILVSGPQWPISARPRHISLPEEDVDFDEEMERFERHLILHAGDRFDIDDFATTGFRDTIKTHETVDNSYGNSYVWITLKSTLSPQVVVESMVAGGLVTKKWHGAEVVSEIPGGVYGIGNERDFNLPSFKQDWLYYHSASMLLGLGYDVRQTGRGLQL